MGAGFTGHRKYSARAARTHAGTGQSLWLLSSFQRNLRDIATWQFRSNCGNHAIWNAGNRRVRTKCSRARCVPYDSNLRGDNPGERISSDPRRDTLRKRGSNAGHSFL